MVYRDGLFHLFYTWGEGTWHAIAGSPTGFNPSTGAYLVGPFVAAEVFAVRGRWYLSASRTEEERGLSIPPGPDDDMRTLGGLHLAAIRRDGDFPCLERPV